MSDIRIKNNAFTLPVKQVAPADTAKFRAEMRKNDASDVVFALGQDTFIMAARSLDVKGIQPGDKIRVDGVEGQVTGVDDNSVASLLNNAEAAVRVPTPAGPLQTVVVNGNGGDSVTNRMKFIAARIKEIDESMGPANAAANGSGRLLTDRSLFGGPSTAFRNAARGQLASLQDERAQLITQLGRMTQIDQAGVITNNIR